MITTYLERFGFTLEQVENYSEENELRCISECDYEANVLDLARTEYLAGRYCLEDHLLSASEIADIIPLPNWIAEDEKVAE